MSGLTIPLDHPFVRAISRGGSAGDTATYLTEVAKSEQQYTVAKIEYDQFKTYSQIKPSTWLNWSKKEVTHLVAPAWHLGFKLPYHLIKGCMVGPCTGTFKTNMYRAACDLQKSKGHFVGFFSERRGEYHLSCADLHEQCYDIMDANRANHARKETEIIRSIGLTDDKLKSISPEKIPETVERLDSERLLNLNFSEKQLQAIPLTKLSKHQLAGLFPFFIAKESPHKSGPKKLVWETCDNPKEEGKRQKAFKRLDVCNLSELEAIEDLLSPEHQVFIVHKIIKTRGFESNLIKVYGPDIIIQALWNLKSEEVVTILESLSPSDLNLLLPYLSIDTVTKLTDTKFQALDFSILTESQVNVIFNTSKVATHQAIVNRMTPLQISVLIPRLAPLQIQVFSFTNDQLKELDLEKLPKNLLQSLLPESEVSSTISIPTKESELSPSQKLELELQKKLAKKVLSVFLRMQAFSKASQQEAIQKHLPCQWALYQAWQKCGSEITHLSPLAQVQKAMEKLPKPTPTESRGDADSSAAIPNTLIGKIHYYAIAFLTHVWNGLCVVTRVATYPIWKPYTIARDYFTAKGPVASKDEIV
ncbi:hypothetical protein [Simkania sp.]|uniref:hypothetical protein n=1 Tax=Simkania sp. TaxID=34094 RepID=UPI003B520B0B